MATSSVILDIRANTNRALADFKRFSAQLDNKFLISGLKLDVVRSALGQINREFQKAIGEQGLTAGQSLRAAQNQASLLLQTFKGFGDEASASITESFSSTFNQIAVTAGGTFDDVKKALAATPWISADLPKEVREKLGVGIMEFQRDAKRAGLAEDFGNIAKRFLAGEINAGGLLESGSALEKNLGFKLQQAGGGPSTIVDAAQRSRVLLDVLSDPKFRDQIAKAAKGAAGFRIILEDLSSTLFNPEKGIFGAVRKVTMAVGDTTTLLDETQKLIESIFGKQGTFVLFFEQIKKIFGLEDPLKTVITGIRWLTKQFNRLNTFLQSPQVQQIVGILRTAFTNIQNFVTKVSDTITSLEDPESEINKANKKIEKFFENLKENINKELENKDSILSRIKNIGTSIGEFFKAIEDAIKAGDWDPSKISQSIRGVGKSIRDFINKIGEEIRSIDVDKQGNFFLEIFKTIVGEIAQTLGTAINEAILTIFSGKGLAVLGGVISVLYEGLSKFFTGLFGGNQLLGGLAGGLATGAVTLAFGKKIALALGGLASRIVKAVPGAGLLIRPISGALGALGRGIATQLRKIPGIKRLIPNVTEPTSTLSPAQTFNRQVISYLQQIASCVCKPGGLGNRGGPDFDRARNDRLGRKQVSDLGYSGPRQRVALRSDGPLEIQPPRRRFGDRVRGFGRGAIGFGRDLVLEGADSPVPGYLDRSRGNVAARFNRRYGSGGTRGVLGRGIRGFGRGIRGFGSGIAEFGRNIYTDVTSSGFDAAGYPIDDDNDSFDVDFPEADSDARDRKRNKSRSTRERFNRRYGSGGRRAQISRGIGKIGRGIGKFGKGALIAGGVTALGAGALGLFGGGAAQASEFDPETGEPIQTPEQQSKQNQMAGVGNVLGGGLEGAMTGAAIGSIIPGIGTATGAVIGAVIGGVIPLLDEGTRKGVADFVSGIGKTLRDVGDNIGKAFKGAGDNISKAASNGIQWIKDGFGSISQWFSNIDWKKVLINALVPGGSMTIEGLKGIAEFASKLNIFDGIKAGIDSIAAPVKSIWDNISSWKPPWAGREVGGPVIKGTSYIVGERGPEIFTPGESGSVSTNRDLMTMKSGGGSASSVSANFNVTINVNGNIGAGNVEELRGPVLAIIKQAWEEASTGIATRGSVI